MYADGHCDYLYKAMKNQPAVMTVDRLIESRVSLQNFAIYVDTERVQRGRIKAREIREKQKIRENRKIIADTYRQLDIFRQTITKVDGVIHVTRGADFVRNDKLHALLSLEGCDNLAIEPELFDALWTAGVRIFGLTWNHDNAYASSCHTRLTTGLTDRGNELVREIASRCGIIDVSHLSEPAFWDIVALNEQIAETGNGITETDNPIAKIDGRQLAIIATHSNCQALCDHRRNLSDRQITALIEQKGIIGINFVPEFLRENGCVTIDDVIRHIDHVLTLGGMETVAIGSDYDGAEMAEEMKSPVITYARLAEALEKRYNQQIMEGIMYNNWQTYLQKHLPYE